MLLVPLLALPPRFEPVQPELLALGGSFVNAWADFDGDGDADLALTGARPDGMHLLLRNLLPSADAARSLQVRVVDGRGRATRAGAEVRLFAAGTRRRLGTRLVDAGSGYDAQSDMPVHFGLAAESLVDVEVTFPAAGRRLEASVRDVRLSTWQGRVLTVRVDTTDLGRGSR